MAKPPQGRKGLGDLRKSQCTEARVQFQVKVNWSVFLTSVKSSFSQSHLCIHTCSHIHTMHTHFKLLLSKSQLNSVLCEHIISSACARAEE